MNQPTGASRRSFLKSAGLLAAAAACAPGSATSDIPSRAAQITHFNGPLLAALGETVLPSALGPAGVKQAIADFVTYCAEYEPVAEEMHGYGYSDIRYLPPDPVPAWQAQLSALDVLAQRVHRKGFAACTRAQREALVRASLRDVRGDGFPSPLHASHVAIAILAHWTQTPDAWNRAMGVEVSPGACRPLDQATRKPLPIAEGRA